MAKSNNVEHWNQNIQPKSKCLCNNQSYIQYFTALVYTHCCWYRYNNGCTVVGLYTLAPIVLSFDDPFDDDVDVITPDSASIVAVDGPDGATVFF